jgi:hypothetical protein
MSNIGIANRWKQVFRSLWKDYGTKFKSILDSLSRHRQLLSEQAALLHYQHHQHDSQMILHHIKQYERDRWAEIDRLNEEERIRKQRDKFAILEWFSASQSTTMDHEFFKSIRSQCSGSGRWILKDDKVNDWLESEIPVSSIMWLNGIPGAGKPYCESMTVY